MKNYIYLILLALITTSCEKVIDVDLNSTNPTLVVEGTITNRDEPQVIKLSRTNDYFASIADLPAEEGAVIKITDSKGGEFLFNEEEPGLYVNHLLIGESDVTYTLSITTNGEEYEASSYLPREPISDTTIYTYQEATIFSEEGFYITNFQTDPAGIGDYYQFRFYTNDTLEDVLTYEDQFFDGQSVDFTFFGTPVELGDTVVVELYNMDKIGFDFFISLDETIQNNDGGPFAGTPQNPVNNISNGALGYFGAYAVVADTVIIK